jgi:anti-sigma B factor antagonist
MEIQSKQLRRCDVVVAKGRIDSATVKGLHEAFAAIKESGRYNIVLDMKDVSYISSAGLGELIDSQTTCKRHGGEVILADVPPRVTEVLDLAGLAPLFKVFANQIEAVGSF